MGAASLSEMPGITPGMTAENGIVSKQIIAGKRSYI
jgi:hypothetical protein